MRLGSLVAATLITILHSPLASASVTLIDKDDWKVTTEGFVEVDTILDSHRGLGESPGNARLAGPSEVNGRNGNFQASIRNSRLGFTFYPPIQNDWKSKGLLELDLLGYDPKPGTSNISNTEASFYTNPTMRVRHAFFNLEGNGWTFLAGQSWSLLGWQSSYVMTTASVGPVAGILYQRTTQLTATHSMDLGDGSKWQNAISLSRPTQRDSTQPNVTLGSRLTWAGRKAGISSATGDVKLEPTSLAISGIFSGFTTPKESTGLEGQEHHSASGFAVDFALPLLTAESTTVSNTLLWTGEFSMGSGYGDQFPGWAGVGQLPDPNGSDLSKQTNLDPGLGGYDSNKQFKLVHLQSWNTQLQYHFNSDYRMFATLGFGQLNASNTGGLTTTYDHVSVYFVNLFHDVTKQVRVGAEYAHFESRYQDAPDALNDRYQINGYFRF